MLDTMKRIILPALVLMSSSAYGYSDTGNGLSFVDIVDTHAVEFHSAIDVVIVGAMAFASFFSLFFG